MRFLTLRIHSRIGGTSRKDGGLLATLLLCVCLASLSSAQDGVPVLVSTLSARQPCIAASPGGDCAVAWTRLEENTARSGIELRRRRNQRWEPVETPCPARPGVAVGEPFVRLDSSGNPHLAWVASEGETSYLEYAFCVGSNWSRFGQFGLLSEPSPLKTEHPVMALRPPNHVTRHTDEVFFAWQERAGSNYRIRAFVIDAAAETHAFILAGGDSLQYAVYPDLLELPPAEPGGEPRMGLCWFNLDQPETRIEMRAWNDLAARWDPVDVPAWDPEWLQTLPLVLSAGAGDPFLLGVDRSDQIFVLTDGTRMFSLSASPYARNRFPRTGRPVGGVCGLVWQQETNAGVELVQAALRPEGQIYATPLASTDDPFQPSEPDVAVTSDSLVSVWVGSFFVPPGSGISADPAQQSLPVILFCETRIPTDAWRSLAPPAEKPAP